jgi:uncharacterized protein (DUF433 family)
MTMAAAGTVDLNVYFDFSDPEAIRVKGHRLGIEHILNAYRNGYSSEQIAQEFPGLELETIYAAITYYLANREEMTRYLTRRQVRYETAYQTWSDNPSQLVQRLRILKESRDAA